MRFWLRNRILVMLNSQICVQRLLGRVFDTSDNFFDESDEMVALNEMNSEWT
nr:AlNc14C212G8944 [Albugo laibachii Nc14]|eukprot:CCA23903.1 AlNc14C212G8944 [Albugo laibachii Nc14]